MRYAHCDECRAELAPIEDCLPIEWRCPNCGPLPGADYGWRCETCGSLEERWGDNLVCPACITAADGRDEVTPGDLIGRRYPVLDHGFLEVIDLMGSDVDICAAARISTGSKARSPEDDTKLITYLWRHKHTSPFEMCELKVHLKLPIFVARQLVRHRTASLNEYSGRYSEMRPEFYIPAVFKSQDTKNRQGSAEPLPSDLSETLRTELMGCAAAFSQYQRMLAAGCSKELARIVLPLNTYTEWVWKIDLHNLLHFLTLRCDPYAQGEIRAYADTLAAIVRDWCPLTHAAWAASLEEV